MSHASRPTAQSFPGVYSSSVGTSDFGATGQFTRDGTHLGSLGFRHRVASLQQYSGETGRRSLASRVSQSIATRLSSVGLRETPREGTVAGVTINTLCNVMGAGVLALPLATRNASVGLALLLLGYVAAMSAYAVYCLVAACDATGRYSVTEVTAFSLYPPRSLDVFSAEWRERHAGDPGEQAGLATTRFHDQGSQLPGFTSDFRLLRLLHANDELRRRRRRRAITVLVESIVFCSNFGSLIIYARVIADSMPPVVGNIFHQLSRAPPLILVHESSWLVASGVIFFLLSCAKNMEELKWSSLLGFLTILYIVLAVAYRFHTASWSKDGDENAKGYPAVDPVARGKIDWLSLPVSALRTVSAYGVAFGYHFNVPYFYRELRDRVPSEMMKSVCYAFPTIIASYAITGVLGYVTFGELVASPTAGGNIVMNYSHKDVLMNIGRLGLFVHFACVFPIVSICARRGLHRLAMMLLTWSEQSALMEVEVADLEEDMERETAHANRPRSPHASPVPDVMERSETTPLLERDGEREGLLSHGGGGDGVAPRTDEPLMTTQTLPSPPLQQPALPINPAELDHDVGSPDDTTRFAIVVEAFLLVAGAVLLAALVSGIGFVIDVIGSLFGVFLILIVPGVVGMCIFSTSFVMANAQDAASGASAEGRDAPVGVRYARVKRGLCCLSAVTGIVFTVVATSIFVLDHTG